LRYRLIHIIRLYIPPLPNSLTLQAKTRAQAAKSSTWFSSDAKASSASCRRALFNRRSVAPQTSAIALCTSTFAFGSTPCIHCHVWETKWSSVEGMRRYLNIDEKVSRRAVKVGALSERGRSPSNRVVMSRYFGERTERRSCVNFCSKLRCASQRKADAQMMKENVLE
jgi:hypothetical protein